MPRFESASFHLDDVFTLSITMFSEDEPPEVVEKDFGHVADFLGEELVPALHTAFEEFRRDGWEIDAEAAEDQLYAFIDDLFHLPERITQIREDTGKRLTDEQVRSAIEEAEAVLERSKAVSKRNSRTSDEMVND